MNLGIRHMKKVIVMFVLLVCIAFTAKADRYAILSRNPEVSSGYNSDYLKITVYVKMTEAAKAKYSSLNVKVIPTGDASALLEGPRRVLIYDEGEGKVVFTCKKDSQMCPKYDFIVIAEDGKEKDIKK